MKKRTATVLDSKNRLRDFTDWLIISGFFASLIPVRLLFVNLVNDDWLGSFGLLTAIVTAVMILNYKQKLGYFGKVFNRFFEKRRRKSKIILGVMFVMVTTALSLFIYGVHYAEDRFEEEKTETMKILDSQGLNSTETMTQESMKQVAEKPELLLAALLVLLLSVFFAFDVFSIAMWTINEISHGFYLDLATVLLVEEIEVMGMLIFYYLYGNKLVKKRGHT